ncbi:acid-sensing ion channel 1-like [Saccoglossus kowalevskii]
MHVAYTTSGFLFKANLIDLDKCWPIVLLISLRMYRKSALTDEEVRYVGYLTQSQSTRDYDTTYSMYDDNMYDDFVNSTGLSYPDEFDFAAFTRRVGYQFTMHDDLLHCVWKGGQLCTSDDFVHVFTRYGNCYTFNAPAKHQYLTQDHVGAGNGLVMFLNVKQEEYTETAFGNYAAGLKIYVHNKDEPPLIESQGHAITPGTLSYVDITQHRSLNLPPKWGQCNPSQQLEFYDSYTIPGCLLEWYSKIMTSVCGCRPFIYPGRARHCTLWETFECVQPTEAAIQSGEYGDMPCPVPCNHTTYPTTMSYANFPSKSVASSMAQLFNISAEYASENYVAVDIFYGRMSYQLSKQTYAMTASALVSDIGGQMGLFLGASVITLMEIAEYIGNKMKHLFCFKKKKTRANNSSNAIHTEQ